MADLPPDLLDRMAFAIWCMNEGYVLPSDRPDNWMLGDPKDFHPDDLRDRESCRTVAADLLAALTEWADGALIDPATWTRWDSRQEAIYCSTHGRLHFGHGRRVAAVCPNDAGCSIVPLYTLTPRED